MTRQFKRLSHMYECKYHIVFCPKYRYKILEAEVAEYMRQRVYRLCERKAGVEVLALNVQAGSYPSSPLDSTQVRSVESGGIHQG